ncbi:hypothetical protein MMC06_002308 [Schaereria dolodes]|nr:hypothetical protein [Schaereria dolodes]
MASDNTAESQNSDLNDAEEQKSTSTLFTHDGVKHYRAPTPIDFETMEANWRRQEIEGWAYQPSRSVPVEDIDPPITPNTPGDYDGYMEYLRKVELWRDQSAVVTENLHEITRSTTSNSSGDAEQSRRQLSTIPTITTSPLLSSSISESRTPGSFAAQLEELDKTPSRARHEPMLISVDEFETRLSALATDSSISQVSSHIELGHAQTASVLSCRSPFSVDAPPCGKSQLQDTMSQQPKLSSCNDSPGGVARSTMPPSPDHPESEACHLVPNAEELVPVSVRSDLKFFWGVPLSTHAPSAHADSVAIGRPPEAAYAKDGEIPGAQRGLDARHGFDQLPYIATTGNFNGSNPEDGDFLCGLMQQRAIIGDLYVNES